MSGPNTQPGMDPDGKRYLDDNRELHQLKRLLLRVQREAADGWELRTGIENVTVDADNVGLIDTDGVEIDPATEPTLSQLASTAATEATLADLRDEVETEDFATEATLASLAATDFSEETTLAEVRDAIGADETLDTVRELLDALVGEDFATESTLSSLDDALDVDLSTRATESTLADTLAELQSEQPRSISQLPGQHLSDLGDLEVQPINTVTQQSLRHEVHNFSSYQTIADGERAHVGVDVESGKFQIIIGFTIFGAGLAFVDIFAGEEADWDSVDEVFVKSNHTLDDVESTMDVNWVDATETTHYDLDDDLSKYAKFAGVGVEGGTLSPDEPGPLQFEIEEPAVVPPEVSGNVFLVVVRNESGEDFPYTVLTRILEVEP